MWYFIKLPIMIQSTIDFIKALFLLLGTPILIGLLYDVAILFQYANLK